MATIFFSMAGEGRGHATRIHTLVHSLRGKHRLVVFAPHEAFDFLRGIYPADEPDLRIERIGGLRFRYRNHRIDLLQTCASAARFAARELPDLVNELRWRIDEESPELIVTDFEPALPRAAARMHVPFISIDHQHMFAACDWSELPFRLRQFARAIGAAVRFWHPTADTTVVSSFFHPPLKARHNAVQVGPLIRPEIARAKRHAGEHVLAYLRPNTPGRVIELLAKCGRETRIYGLGSRPTVGKLRFCEFDAATFADDLASCRAVVGASGHQLLSEALFLKKPALALPETRHHEQEINAFYLQKLGAGAAVSLEHLDELHLRNFKSRLTEFDQRLDELQLGFDGSRSIVDLIESRFTLPSPKSQSAAATRMVLERA